MKAIVTATLRLWEKRGRVVAEVLEDDPGRIGEQRPPNSETQDVPHHADWRGPTDQKLPCPMTH